MQNRKTKTTLSATQNGPRKRGTKRAKATLHTAEPQTAVEVVEEPTGHVDVRQRAMLVTLTVHQWLAKATDVEITAEVSKQHDIKQDMGRFEKMLLSKSALDKLRSAGNKLRACHNRYTRPWNEWGTRILKGSEFPKYSAEMRQLIADYDQIFRDELEATGLTGKSRYEEHKEEARALLNSSFREQDYPSMDVLRRKFGAEIGVDGIPSGHDFRVDLSAEVLVQVRAEMEAKSDKRIQNAINGMVEDLRDMVAKLAEALKSEKSEAIRQSLFTSIQRMVDRLPGLNFTEDPAITAFAAEVQQLIVGVDAKQLREKAETRGPIAHTADEILAKMTAFLG